MSHDSFRCSIRRLSGALTFASLLVACSQPASERSSLTAVGGQGSSGGSTSASGTGGTDGSTAATGGTGQTANAGSMNGAGGSLAGTGGSTPDNGGEANAPATGGTGTAMAGKSGSSAGKGGSSAGKGGSTSMGAGGKPPMTVGSCDKLPAPGTWEEITPNASAMQGSNALAMDPFDAGTLWISAGTQSPGGIYKSTDCGASWTLVSTGDNSDAVNAMGMTSMVIDPVNKGTIYASPGSNGGAGTGLWKSTNGGKDWTQLIPPDSEVGMAVQFGLVNSIGMEATNPSHLVIGMHAACNPPYGVICEAETTDGGMTWTITTVDIPGLTDWVGGEGAFLIDANTWLFGTYSNGLWLTKDRGATWKEVTAQGAQGASGGKTLNAPFVKAADGNYYLADMNGVNQSSDGESWKLLPNSGGRSVGIATGLHAVYTGDGWSNTYHSATFADLATWTTIAPPASQPNDQGSQYMGFDSAHSVLYTSDWFAGAWRMVVKQ